MSQVKCIGSQNVAYKYCAVPKCPTTTFNNPDKIFFTSPMDKKLRAQWLKLMRRKVDDLSINTKFFVCEDHFDLPNDVENFMKFKYYAPDSCRKIPLKKGTVPHKFLCQNKEPKHTRKSPKNRSILGEIYHKNTETEVNVKDEMHSDNVSKLEKGVQCEILVVASKNKHRSKCVQTSNELFKKDVALSPIKPKHVKILVPSTDDNECSDPEESDVSDMSIYEPHSAYDESDESTSVNGARNISINLCRKKPKIYLGIQKKCLVLCDILAEKLKCTVDDIYIVFEKIKLNRTFEEIGDNFELEKSAVSKKFAKLTPRISACLKHFIFWPSTEKILLHLPIAFRANFKNVQTIIDCFEIQIQKPTDPVLQSLTWSSYKKCNTIKYLIGSTPHGFICYLSQGFGGRSSDIQIVKNTDFLTMIPQNSELMADRGFKGIDQLLQPFGCKLIRPPSVKEGEKLSRQDVIRSKAIASLRIHIERVINRIRMFHFLEPHACVPIKMIKRLDEAVIIASALCNIQPSLIKTT